MKTLNSLSVFFPAYNDARALPDLIAKTFVILPTIAKEYEVIVVNDGSHDNTEEVGQTLAKKYRKLRVITHKRNKGYGGALQTGFKEAKKEWIFYTDGDGQYDPKYIHELLRKLKGTVTVVNGIKLNRGDGFMRKTIGLIYNVVLQQLYDLPISDVDCDFRLIKRSLLKNITLNATSGLICVELILKLQKAGAVFAEVGVPHYKRKYGHSQFFHPKHLFKTLGEHILFYKKHHSIDYRL